MFLKNKNIIFKIRRSKVTDYAALMNDRRYILTYSNEINRSVFCHILTHDFERMFNIDTNFDTLQISK